MTLLGAGAGGSIAPVVTYTAGTDSFPDTALSFSRPSLATMFDSTGKLTYAPNNLLTQSNTFSNAAWNNQSSTLTSGQTDPLGGTNAWRLQGGNNNWYLYQTPSYGGNAIVAFWVKSNTGANQTFRLFFNGVATSNFTATTSWQQFYVSGANAAGAINGIIRDSSNNNVDILIYAATFSAVTYETTPRTADQVITTSAAYYGPRIDYTYSSTPGLLVEGARTNLLTQSALTLTGYGASTYSANTSGAITPLGIYQGSILTEGTASAVSQSGFVSAPTLAANTTHTLSVLAYLPNRAYASIGFSKATSDIARATITLASGAYTIQTAGTGSVSSASAKDVGSGWYLLKVTVSFGANVPTLIWFATSDVSSPVSTDVYESPIYVGSTSNKSYWTAAQIEAATDATSYIPTAAASVTRAADALAAAAYSSNPAIIQYRDQATGTRARKKLTTFSSISSETAEWIEAIRVYPVGTSSAYLDGHLTVDGAW